MVEHSGMTTLAWSRLEQQQEAAEDRYQRELKAHPLDDFAEQAEANLHGDFGFQDYMEMHCMAACIGICEHYYALSQGNGLEQLIKDTCEYGMYRELWLHGERARLQREFIEGIFP